MKIESWLQKAKRIFYFIPLFEQKDEFNCVERDFGGKNLHDHHHRRCCRSHRINYFWRVRQNIFAADLFVQRAWERKKRETFLMNFSSVGIHSACLSRLTSVEKESLVAARRTAARSAGTEFRDCSLIRNIKRKEFFLRNYTLPMKRVKLTATLEILLFPARINWKVETFIES